MMYRTDTKPFEALKFTGKNVKEIEAFAAKHSSLRTKTAIGDKWVSFTDLDGEDPDFIVWWLTLGDYFTVINTSLRTMPEGMFESMYSPAPQQTVLLPVDKEESAEIILLLQNPKIAKDLLLYFGFKKYTPHFGVEGYTKNNFNIIQLRSGRYFFADEESHTEIRDLANLRRIYKDVVGADLDQPLSHELLISMGFICRVNDRYVHKHGIALRMTQNKYYFEWVGGFTKIRNLIHLKSIYKILFNAEM